METKQSKKVNWFLGLEKIAAAVAASFLPGAVYWIAHVETVTDGRVDYTSPLWLLVIAGLTYSAPSVSQWANGWTGRDRLAQVKSIGFTILLESVLVFSRTEWLSLAALAILSGINCLVAVAAMRNRTRAFAVTTKRNKRAKPTKTPAIA